MSTSVISISAARSGVNGHRTHETKIQQRPLPNLHECTGIFRRALRGSCQISTVPPRPAVHMLLPLPHRRHVLYGAPAGSHAPPQPAIATTVLPAAPPPLAGSSAPFSGSGVGSPPPAPAMLRRPCPPRPSSCSGGPRPRLSRCHSSPLPRTAVSASSGASSLRCWCQPRSKTETARDVDSDASVRARAGLGDLG